MKKIFCLISTVLLSPCLLRAESKVFQKGEPIVWAGIDFSRACFVSTFDFTDHRQLKGKILEWNDKLYKKSKKYDLRRILGHPKITLSTEYVETNNKKTDFSNLVADEAKGMDENTIKEVVSKFGYDGMKYLGTAGLVVITESMIKSTKKAVFHIVFFDVGNKSIIHTEKIETEGGGIGFDFWGRAVDKLFDKIREKAPQWHKTL